MANKVTGQALQTWADHVYAVKEHARALREHEVMMRRAVGKLLQRAVARAMEGWTMMVAQRKRTEVLHRRAANRIMHRVLCQALYMWMDRVQALRVQAQTTEQHKKRIQHISGVVVRRMQTGSRRLVWRALNEWRTLARKIG